MTWMLEPAAARTSAPAPQMPAAADGARTARPTAGLLQRSEVCGVPGEATEDLDVQISQGLGGGAVPAAGDPACPATISVAEIVPVDVTAAQIETGVRAGWGALTRMEVSGGGRSDWNGTKVREVLSAGTNSCDKSPGCGNASGQGGNAGSVFTVGGASPAFKHPKLGEVVPAKPATKNSFWDIHVEGGGVDWCAGTGSCARGCTQHYECGGKQFGPEFAVSFSYATVSRKDAKSGSFCAGTLTKTAVKT